MTVTVYKSTDPGAPVLSGQAGTLINVLDACLVNGYGAKPSAGWTKSYSGTNKAAYRMPPGTNQHYLRVDDSNAQHGLMVGYESMSDVDTGTGPFPTAAQMANGVFLYKSATANSTARAWYLITNGKIFYLIINMDGNETRQQGFGFGQIDSRKSGDAYHTIIMGGTGSSYQASYVGFGYQMSSLIPAHYMARSYSQTGTSIQVGKHQDRTRDPNGYYLGRGQIPYPDPVNSELLMGRLFVHESQTVIRGSLPGIWNPAHYFPLSEGDIFAGSGVFSGKTFEVKHVAATSSYSQIFFEISDTW